MNDIAKLNDERKAASKVVLEGSPRLQELDAALKAQAQVAQAPVVAEAAAEPAPAEASAAPVSDATELSSEVAQAPVPAAKPARPVVAVRGDDRPGQKKTEAPEGKPGRREGRPGERRDDRVPREWPARAGGRRVYRAGWRRVARAGRPGRAAALARFLDYVLENDQVWIATRLDIAHHWYREHPGK